jgi:hypothetical protein
MRSVLLLCPSGNANNDVNIHEAYRSTVTYQWNGETRKDYK